MDTDLPPYRELEGNSKAKETKLSSDQKYAKTENTIETDQPSDQKHDKTTKSNEIDTEMNNATNVKQYDLALYQEMYETELPSYPELNGTEKTKEIDILSYTELAAIRKPKENEKLHYSELDETKKTKLNQIFEEISSKFSIDYSNQEIQDIQTAVHTMLKRVVTRINKRRLFKISRIQPCGSMAEQTAAWKYDKETGERYTEFDFLAVLDGDPKHDLNCGGCIDMKTPPAGLESVWTVAISQKDISLFGNESIKEKVNGLFWRELNSCLVVSCNCFSMVHDSGRGGEVIAFKVSLADNSSDIKQPGCAKCVVETTTGTLSVNDSISVGRARETLIERAIKCSLLFTWTSKRNKLSVHDQLHKADNTISIHVDFLPAFELSKTNADGHANEHDCFIVPKNCEVCQKRKDNEKWRRSSSMAEIDYIVNEMSEKHRKCFKILKYCLSAVDKAGHIRGYFIKSTVLLHSRECLDSTEGCADCVLKMIAELKRSYETKNLKTFRTSVDILSKIYSWKSKLMIDILDKFLNRLCSVTSNDSYITLIHEGK